MIPILRPYQEELSNEIDKSLVAGNNAVLAVSATGSGKTVLMCKKIKDYKGVVFVIAHRHELVGQISQTLADFEVRHHIVASQSSIGTIVKNHVKTKGSSYFNPSSTVVVASVDTLLRRTSQLSHLITRCTLWLVDEAHHVVADNKWGKAVALFPNAKGIGVTATPVRASGEGLGSHCGGVFDAMVVGRSMRWLIDNGFLSDYRIFCPQSDIDLSNVKIGKATGEYSPKALKKAIEESRIVGDVVEQYLKIANGLQGITFAVDVMTATAIADKFMVSGVAAKVVHGGMSDSERHLALSQFRDHSLQQLVNVGLFAEGLDVPGICVVSMARPTNSFSLYSQQFGRALRKFEGKSHAIIIDHVGNVVRHGLPDIKNDWSLDAKERRGSNKTDDSIPLTACLNTDCMAVYEKVLSECPFCGSTPTVSERSTPKEVMGDLVELDVEAMRKIHSDFEKTVVDGSVIEHRMKKAGVENYIAASAKKKHDARREATLKLRESMAVFAWIMQSKHGYGNRSIFKKFYFTFGIDMGTAQSMPKKDSDKLKERIDEYVNGFKSVGG